MRASASMSRPYDYSQLRARTAELGQTDKSVAIAGGMTPATYSLKLNDRGIFSQDQIIAICDFLRIEYVDIPRYFFTHKV